MCVPSDLCAHASWARFPVRWLWSRRLTEPPRPMRRGDEPLRPHAGGTSPFRGGFARVPSKRLPPQRELSAVRLTEDILHKSGKTLVGRGGSVSRRDHNQLTGNRAHSQAKPTLRNRTRRTPAALRERGVWGERGFSQRSRLSPQRVLHLVSWGGSAREGASLQRSPLPRI